MEEGRHSQIHQCGRNCSTILRYPNNRHLVTHSEERAVVCWGVLLDSYPPVKRQADGINAETSGMQDRESAVTRLNLRSDKAASQVQVSTKVGEPPMYLYTKVGEPPHQSRCRSAILLEKLWRTTEFGAE